MFGLTLFKPELKSAVAADIGSQDVALDTQHDGAALPAIAADGAAEDAAGIGRTADRGEIVIDRSAADRAPQPPAFEHVLGRQRSLHRKPAAAPEAAYRRQEWGLRPWRLPITRQQESRPGSIAYA